MKIKCLVIDDEPSSQQILKKFISDVDFLELVVVCNDANAALRELKMHSDIDLLFLDINMPKITGLTFYKSLQNPPDVIFTTAYPQYAVDGFEVNAIDYLLKPFSFERFLSAANKVLEKKSIINNVQEDNFLLIKSNKVIHRVSPDEIEYIEAYGDYVKVYVQNNCIVTNSTFTKMLNQLSQKLFRRTHKSFAVNLNKVKSISANEVITIKNKVPIGQKYREDFLSYFKKNKLNLD